MSVVLGDRRSRHHVRSNPDEREFVPHFLRLTLRRYFEASSNMNTGVTEMFQYVFQSALEELHRS